MGMDRYSGRLTAAGYNYGAATETRLQGEKQRSTYRPPIYSVPSTECLSNLLRARWSITLSTSPTTSPNSHGIYCSTKDLSTRQPFLVDQRPYRGEASDSGMAWAI